jgi:hypothetical protein
MPDSPDLFEGICPEAKALLERKNVCPTMLHVLTRMTFVRQAEAARLMVAANCYEAPYAKALIGASDRSQINTAPGCPRNPMSPGTRERVNQEITELANQLNELSVVNGSDLLILFVFRRYAATILGNPRIGRYLERAWPAILEDLTALVHAKERL